MAGAQLQPPPISMGLRAAFAPSSASRLAMFWIFRRAAFSSSRFSVSNFATSSSPIASAMVTRPSYAADLVMLGPRTRAREERVEDFLPR